MMRVKSVVAWMFTEEVAHKRLSAFATHTTPAGLDKHLQGGCRDAKLTTKTTIMMACCWYCSAGSRCRSVASRTAAISEVIDVETMADVRCLWPTPTPMPDCRTLYVAG